MSAKSTKVFGSLILFASVLLPPPVRSEQADQAAIRAALLKWSMAFNEGNTRDVCELFSPDLRYDYRGSPERDYDQMCKQLRKTLGNKDKKFHYSAEIKEILVRDDMAVVRIVWTLSISNRTDTEKAAVSKEYGLDVFRREASGDWRITRFLGYDAP